MDTKDAQEYREGLRQEIRQLAGYAHWDDSTRDADYHRPPIEMCISQLHVFRLVFGKEKTAEDWRQYTADAVKRADYDSWLDLLNDMDKVEWENWKKNK